WSGSAPPVLIGEEETIVSVPEPEPEPESESESEPEPEAEPQLDPDPAAGSEPEAAAEEATAREFASEPTAPPSESLAEDLESEDALPEQGATLLSLPVEESSSSLSPPSQVAAEPVEEALPEGAEVAAEAATQLAVSTAGLERPRTIAPSASLPPLLLERIEPSMGRGERIRLDVRHWHISLGRAEENDVRLYTASASREHALIEGNEDGEWIMTPAEGKSVFIDGEPVWESLPLEVGMNLVMGKDHLRCVTEGLERRETTASTEAFGSPERGWAERLRGQSPLRLGGSVLGAVLLLAIFRWLAM
ncbi:MAG: FHA domain-containing protein, partial [Myxococcota bacterium]